MLEKSAELEDGGFSSDAKISSSSSIKVKQIALLKLSKASYYGIL